MDSDNVLRDKLIEKIVECETLRSQLDSKIRELKTTLKEICDGSCNRIRIETHNFPSTYYDKAYSESNYKCDICGYYEKLK